jgi:predicted neutral ceramidase superfamily lipid hydrolase
MFLPFFEGPGRKEIIPEDSFVVAEIYDSPEFGLRMWVFNGFGSLFALVNLAVAIVLLLCRFFFPKSLPTAVITSIVFVTSLFLLMWSNSEKHGVVLTDEMLIGFYLMLISQVILITQCLTKAITEVPKDRRGDSDILDF